MAAKKKSSSKGCVCVCPPNKPYPYKLPREATHMSTEEAFDEIMSGPNPLTRVEIRNVLKKRPDWDFLRKFI